MAEIEAATGPCRHYTAQNHVISASHGGATVLLDPVQERYFRLTGVGSQIWSMLCDGTTKDAIVEELARNFADVPAEQLASDVNATLLELHSARLVLCS